MSWLKYVTKASITLKYLPVSWPPQQNPIIPLTATIPHMFGIQGNTATEMAVPQVYNSCNKSGCTLL